MKIRFLEVVSMVMLGLGLSAQTDTIPSVEQIDSSTLNIKIYEEQIVTYDTTWAYVPCVSMPCPEEMKITRIRSLPQYYFLINNSEDMDVAEKLGAKIVSGRAYIDRKYLNQKK